MRKKAIVECTRKEKLFRIVGISFLFTIMMLVLGPQIVPDSESYINGDGVRAVFYPFFLLANRQLCSLVGMDSYLWLVIFEQNLLAVIAISLLAEYWIKRWKIGTICGCLVYLCLVGIWFFELLMDSRWTTNAIFSEGLCFSLFYLCIYFFLKYVDSRKIKWMCGVCITLFLMILCRKAALVFLPCFLIGILWIEKKWNRKVCFMLVLMAGMLLLVKPLTNIYNNLWENNTEITNYDANLLANYVYFGTQEDYTLLNEDEAKVYDYVYWNFYNGGYTYELASNEYSGCELAYRRSKNYDYASFELINAEGLNNISTYFGEKYQLSTGEAIEYTKNLFLSLEMKIVKNHWKEFLYCYFMRGMEGMIRTTFLDIKGFRIGSLLLYIVYVGLLIANRKNRRAVEWSVFLLLLILINSFGVAVFIFPAYRYMIYNMGLFYLTIVTNWAKKIR